jgi:hypothetical protein
MPSDPIDWAADAPTLLSAVQATNVSCADKRRKHNVGHGDPVLIDPAVQTMDQLIVEASNYMWADQSDKNVDDTTLFAVKKLLNKSQCAHAFPSTFDGSGAVRLTRRPMGKPPVAIACGVKWLFLVDSRYVLTGEDLAESFPWFLSNNRSGPPRGSSPFGIGYVIVPEDWTPEDY